MAQKAMKDAEAKIDSANAGAAIAMQNATSRKLSLGKKFQIVYANVDQVYSEVADATVAANQAVEFAWQASRLDRDRPTGSPATLTDAEIKRMADDDKAAKDQIAKAKQTATAAWELLPRDPPMIRLPTR